MRIGINGQLLRKQFSGVDYYIADLVRYLSAFAPDHEYFFYINKHVAEKNMFAGANLSIKKTNFSNRIRPIRIIWEQTCLPSRLKKDKIDLFHAPGYTGTLFSSIPSVVTIHDVVALRFPELCQKSNHFHYKLFIPLSARKVRRIITVSQNSKNDISGTMGIPEDKIDVIPHGVHPSFIRINDRSLLDQIRKKYNISERMILFVGNLEPKKNIERILEAFHLMKMDNAIEHTLVVAGKKGWLYNGIFNKVEELGIEQHVRFLGYVPRDDLPLLYNAAEVFVFPSLYEGFGIPPLEAMACGVPVVTSNVSALPEVTGDAAILVDPYDVEAIADAVYNIISNEKLKNELREKGMKRAKLFSWKNTVKGTLGVYKKALYQ